MGWGPEWELAELDSKVLDEVYDGLRANNDNTRTVYGPQHRNLSQTGDSLLDHGPIQIQVKPSDPEFAIQQQKAMIKVAKAQLKNPERSKRAQRIITVSYTHLRAHETDSYLVCRLLLEKNAKMGAM